MNRSNKKILIVSRSFYPVNSPRSIRATELAKEFARKGHSVTVLTPKVLEHKDFAKEFNVEIQDLGLPKWQPIVLKGNGLVMLFKRGLSRGLQVLFEYPDSELFFQVKNVLKMKRRQNEKYDLLISIAVPYQVHWGVAAVWKKKNNIAKTWVADCGDPFMGLQNDTFKKAFYFKYVEKWFCRKVDYLTVPFAGAINAYYKEFHSKIRVIPQGLEFPKKISSFAQSVNKTPITFAYFGNIQSYIHYASIFLENLNYVERDFKFVIYTNKKEIYEEYLTKSTLLKCDLNDYIPRMELLTQLKDVDFLIHFPYRHGSQKSLKLIDYNFLEKPILSFTGDSNSKVVFNEFLDFNFKNQMERDNIDCYRIENVVKEFLKLGADA